MKKYLKRAIVIVIMLVVVCFSKSVYAETFSMSDEELDNIIQNFSEKLKEEVKNSDTENADLINDLTIKRENDTIKMELSGEVIEFKYDFSNDCRFYIDTKYTKSMTSDELNEVSQNAGSCMYGFLIISSDKGNSILDSMVYMLFTLLEDAFNSGNWEELDEEITGLEYAQKVLNAQPVDKELFRIESSKVSENNEEIVVRTSYIVKTDADFSVVKGAAEDFVWDENTDSNNSNNSNNNGQLDDEKVLPEAGIDITLVNTLKISSVVAGVIVFILLIKLLSSRERKNEQ